MENQTLYDSLYQSLTRLIKTQRLPYGSTLPSSTQLTKMYRVGIRTVKEVLHALEAEGYIELKERKKGIVIYQGEVVLNRAQSLYMACVGYEDYRELLLCFPHIYANVWDIITVADIAYLKELLHGLDKKRSDKKRQVLLEFHLFLLSLYHNDLLSDLHLSLMEYLEFPILRSEPLFAAYDEQMEAYFLRILHAYEQRNPLLVYQLYERLEKESLRQVQGLRQRLEKQIILPAHTWIPWQPKIGHGGVYTAVFRELIQRIYHGQYPVNTYLPSLQTLAEEFSVSYLSIRKAIKQLRDLGIATTINGVGTKILEPHMMATKRLQDPYMIRDALYVCKSLQLFTWIIHPLILHYFDELSQHKKILYEESKHMNMEHLLFFDMLSQSIHDAGMHHIFTQLRSLLSWGSYFLLLWKEDKNDARIYTQLYQTMIQALYEGKKNACAIYAQDFFVQLFTMLQKTALCIGIEDARLLAISKDRFWYEQLS